MSANLGNILTFLASLAIVTPILKFIFLSSYRTHLRRSKYVENRDLFQTYYNETFLKKDEKNKFILQADTNVLMGNDRYPYQIIFLIIESKSQFFYKVIDTLNFCKLYLKQEIEGNNIQLISKFSKKRLKIAFDVYLTSYIFITLLWIICNIYFFITTGKLLNNNILDLIVITNLFLAYPAAKAKATLKLAKILEIRFNDN